MSIPNTNAVNVGGAINHAVTCCGQTARAAGNRASRVAHAAAGFFESAARATWNGARTVACTSWNVTKMVSSRVAYATSSIGHAILCGTHRMGHVMSIAASKISHATCSAFSSLSHLMSRALAHGKESLACGCYSARTFIAAHKGFSGFVAGAALVILGLLAYNRATAQPEVVVV